MPNKKKITHDEKIISALMKIKTPIIDSIRNIKIFFKERSRSNETGIEHVAKAYHNLDASDIELLEKGIKSPVYHSRDKRYGRTYCYYYRRKKDRKNYIKVVVKLEKRDTQIGFISSMFITTKLR